MTFNGLTKLASSLSKMVDDNEKLSLLPLSKKLREASEAFPEDYTIGMVKNVVARMADTKLFISRAELKDLYNKLYSRNTKFSELFKNELKEESKLATPSYFNRLANEEPIKADVNYDMVNELGELFQTKEKVFDKDIETFAKQTCAALCETGNVEVVDCNKTAAICRANFETPKGITSVFVPMDIEGNQIVASVFIGNNGIEKLASLNEYVEKYAGQKSMYADNVIIEFCKKASFSSDVDLVLAKMQVKALQINNEQLHKQASEEAEKLSEVHSNSELESFSSRFDNPTGRANFRFGSEMVSFGRNVILNKLSNMGFKKCQISVCGNDESSISYAVAAYDKNLAFKTTVKIVNDKVLDPSVVLANGTIEAFSKEGLNSLIKAQNSDNRIAAIASRMYDQKPSELIDVVRQSVQEEDYVKAEEALNILAQGEDDKAHQIAIAIYSRGLSGKIEKTSESKCSLPIKSANSTHILCGHTNLPLHKVYQDAYNQCKPLYRKGMEESYEGATFLTSKVFL